MWCKAGIQEAGELTDLFWKNIEAAPEYISHGEIQMGVADAPGHLAEDGKQVWKKYIEKKIAGSGEKSQLPSTVLVYRENSGIEAFCVLEISKDGCKPFGVICDMLVRPQLRGTGLGKELLCQAKCWFKSMNINDIYLESGVNNHAAHAFFKKHHFREISHIFKLME